MRAYNEWPLVRWCIQYLINNPRMFNGKVFTTATETSQNSSKWSHFFTDHDEYIYWFMHQTTLIEVIRLRNSMSNLTFSQNFRLFSFLLFQLFLAECKVSSTEEKCYFGFDVGKMSLISDFSKLNNFN